MALHEIIMIKIDENFRKMSRVFYFPLSEIAEYFSIDILEYRSKD